MSSEQLLERLRKEVLDKKKDEIIREIVSQRISEFSGEPPQNIPSPVSNSTNNLLSSRMEHLLNITTSSVDQEIANHLLQHHKN